MSMRSEARGRPLSESRLARLAGVALVVASSLIRVGDIGGKVDETPYLGVGYVLLIAGCAVAAVLLLHRARSEHRWGRLLGGGAVTVTLLGFVLTRTVGLPQATDDSGNWHEMLGVWSMVAEWLSVVLAAACLAAVGGERSMVP